MNNIINNLSIMYVSCDTYKSLWYPFIKLKNKYLNINNKMYLCTDIKPNIDFELNNIDILYYGNKSNFTINGNLYDRYLYYLNNITTDYILYFYDDMYPIDFIDTNIINDFITLMIQNDDIKIIKLSLESYPFLNGIQVSYNNYNFIKANNNLDDYIFNTQPILIKKNFFIDIINYCKLHNTFTHQNGGLEIYGTKYFRNTNYICLRSISDIIKIPYSGGIVTSGILSDNMKLFLKNKEDIDIPTYDYNLIYKITKEEYDLLGDHLKEHYKNIGLINL